MTIQGHKHLFALSAFGFGTIIFYIWFVNTGYFVSFKAWSQQNLVLYCATLFVIKIVGIIWPPIPGGLFTLGSVPILGWPLAYAVDYAGSAAGSSDAFFIARRWGMSFMKKIFDEDTIERLNRGKIRPHREIETVFLLRVFGGTIIEVICYGAGVLGVKYRNFLTATLLSHPLLGIPVYYLAEGLLSGKGFFVNLTLISIAAVLFYKLKNRYFEYHAL